MPLLEHITTSVVPSLVSADVKFLSVDFKWSCFKSLEAAAFGAAAPCLTSISLN